MNSVNRNSIAQKSAIDLETSEMLQMVSQLRQIAYGDKRASAILNVLVHNLHLPAAVELLRQELRRAPFTSNSADAIQDAQRALAAIDAPPIIQPPAPKAAEPKKKSPHRRKANGVKIKVDLELARVAMALMHERRGLSPALRVYFVLADIIQRVHAQGKTDQPASTNSVTTDAGFEALSSYGIKFDRPNFNAALRAGVKYGLLRCVDHSRGIIYLNGYVNVSQRLTELAHDCRKPEIVKKDRPGVRRTFIYVGGHLKAYHARIYGAWLAKNPTIARETLEILFGRTAAELRTWERIERIPNTPNFAQTVDLTDPRIPSHAVIGEGKKNITATWRRPNTYYGTPVRQSNHLGQGRKARKASNSICDERQHLENGARSHSVIVRNFGNPTLTTHLKPAFEKAFRKWKKATHSDLRMEYLLLGIPRRRRYEGQRVRVWELMRGDRPPQTNAGDYLHVPVIEGENLANKWLK